MNLFFIAQRARTGVDRPAGPARDLGPGDFFGELGLIEMHPRTATVVAEDEITCVLLPAWEFRDVLAEHPEMAVPMLFALVGRLHGMAPHEHPAEHTPG